MHERPADCPPAYPGDPAGQALGAPWHALARLRDAVLYQQAWRLASVLGALAGATALAAAAAECDGAVRRALAGLLVSFVLAALGLVGSLGHQRRQARSPHPAAASAARRALLAWWRRRLPAAATKPLTALTELAHAEDLLRPTSPWRASPLAARHLARAEQAAALATAELLAGPRPPARLGPRTPALAWGALALALVACPLARSRLWQRLAGQLVLDASAEPLSADWRAVVRFPAYQRRPPAAPSLSTGDIAAPMGSTVALSATLDHAVAWAELWLFADAAALARREPLLRLPAQLEGGVTLHAEVPVRAPLLMAAVLGNEPGRGTLDTPAHALVPVADRPPSIAWRAPKERSVWPPAGPVPLSFRLEDDYGVARLRLCAEPLRGAGAPPAPRRCRPLAVPPAEAPELSPGEQAAHVPYRALGQAEVDFAELLSGPEARGDATVEGFAAVRLTLEADDADDVTGPHTGRSSERTLLIFDAGRLHAEAMARLRAAQGPWLAWLGAELVHRPLEPAIQTAHAAMKAANDLLAADRQALQAVRQLAWDAEQFAATAAAGLGAGPGPARAREARLMALLLAFDRLLAAGTRSDSSHAAGAVDASLGTLSQALAQGEAATDSAEVAAAFARFKEQLEAWLATQAQRAPTLDEQLGVEHSERPSGFAAALERIEQALARGDAAAAAKELAALGERVRQAQQQQREQADQQRDPLSQATQAALARLAEGAAKAAESEQRIAQQLATLAAPPARAPAAKSEAARQRFKQALAQVNALAHTAGAPSPVASYVEAPLTEIRERAQSAGELAQSGDVADALAQLDRLTATSERLASQLGPLFAQWGERAEAPGAAATRQVGEALRALPAAADRAKAALAALRQGERQALADSVARALPPLRAQQQRTAQAIEQLERELAELHAQAPTVPSSHPKLAEAARQAKAATGELSCQSPGAAGTAAREAALALEALLADLQAGAAMSQAADGEAVPLPGASGSLPSRAPSPGGQGESSGTGPGAGSEGDAQQPGSPQPGGSAGAQPTSGAAQRGASGDDVELPGFDARRDPSALRAHVLEAAQQPPPPPYERAVKRYYRELLE